MEVEGFNVYISFTDNKGNTINVQLTSNAINENSAKAISNTWESMIGHFNNKVLNTLIVKDYRGSQYVLDHATCSNVKVYLK